ncbi:MAG: hypothetical protein J6N70_15420 [Oribacterium sp.]|nr:hypothetical protein [Oribacterium sp.]
MIFRELVPYFFDDLREVVIDGIKFQMVIPAPGDGVLQGFAGTAGPKNQFVAGVFLGNQIMDQREIWFPEFRPVAEASVPSKSTAMI